MNTESPEDILYQALSAAKKAFYDSIEEEEYDGAYFSISLDGFILDDDFKRITKISIEGS